MAKLALTAERRRIINVATAEWLQVGLSTEPADFDAAETAVASLYERIGRKRPYFVRLSSPLGAELYLNLLVATWPQFRDQLGDQLGDQLRDQLGDQLGDQLWGQLRDQLRGQLWSQLWDQLRDQLRDQLWDQLWGQLWGQLGNQLGDQLRGQIGGQLWDQLRDQLRGQLGGQKIRRFDTWWWGGWDAYLWGFYDGGRRVGGTYPPGVAAALDDHLTVVRSVGWVYPFVDFVVLTDRPDAIHRDEQGRLHCEHAAALSYRDGCRLYAVHGVRVPAHVIDAPERITVEMIDAERNAEVRRVMVDRYCRSDEVHGAAAYIRDAGGARLDHDDVDGTLWRREVPDDEPIVMLEVVNSTPEPDGRFKRYYLRVPPTMHTAREARAWTFGMAADEFRPLVET